MTKQKNRVKQIKRAKQLKHFKYNYLKDALALQVQHVASTQHNSYFTLSIG